MKIPFYSIALVQEEKMKTLSKAVIAALVFGGSVSVANAGGVITNIEATDVSGGTFNSGVIGDNHDINISKTFSSIDPISLRFTVAHENGTGGIPIPLQNPSSIVPEWHGPTFTIVS
jgi:hypothetical protein